MEMLIAYIVIALICASVLMVLSDRGIGWKGVKHDDLEDNHVVDRTGLIIFCSFIWPITLIILTVGSLTEWVLDNVINKKR